MGNLEIQLVFSFSNFSADYDEIFYEPFIQTDSKYYLFWYLGDNF